MPPVIPPPKKLNLNSRELGAVVYYLFAGKTAAPEQLDELQKKTEHALSKIV